MERYCTTERTHDKNASRQRDFTMGSVYNSAATTKGTPFMVRGLMCSLRYDSRRTLSCSDCERTLAATSIHVSHGSG